MATPREIYESDFYRKLARTPQTIAWAWFQDVYDALGQALSAAEQRDEADGGTSTDKAASASDTERLSFCSDDMHAALYQDAQYTCPYCKKSLLVIAVGGAGYSAPAAYPAPRWAQ